MGTTDLRTWLEEVERMGELKHVNGLDWNLEIGCYTAVGWGKKDSPALLFDRIGDYQPGLRVLTNPMQTTQRVAYTLNLPHPVTDLELTTTLTQTIPRWEAALNQFSPNVVKDGPILENVQSAEKVDILAFPVPKWHELDAGRYIGTGDAVITRDPDTQQVNLGAYRIMVHDRKTTGFWSNPGRHGRIHRDKYHSAGKACPVAVSVGHHPLFFVISSTTVPEGAEYQYIGAIVGRPVDVIIEEVTGLPVPADSEIVLAGWCPAGQTRMEGPFGEWHGYYATKENATPIINVERVYYRNAPIILGSPPGRAPDGSTHFGTFIKSAMLQNELVRAGVPDVRGVWVVEVGGQLMITVSIKQRYAGHARQAALLASQSRAGSYMNRYTIVVDEDIDPTDTHQVLWAMCTRSDPATDIDILRRCRSSPADPTIRKPATAFFNSRAIIDACKPFEWIDDFPKTIAYENELIKRMDGKWR